jgi:mannose-6-phosphate isomerase-like protein (cupin superfamily)
MEERRTPTEETSRSGHPVADRPEPPDLGSQPPSGSQMERFERLSAGLYVLDAGADDPQQPHTEDEVYHVLEGRAVLEVAGEQRPVQPGSIVFVAAGVAHRFHSIASKLAVMVFFAPAQGTTRPG